MRFASSSHCRRLHFLMVAAVSLLSLLSLSPLPVAGLPAAASAVLPHQLRAIDRTNVFDQQFLQRALRGQIPGVDTKFVLDLAYWFHSKSIPCCERLLAQTGTRHLYNCTSLPQPSDHSSTVFLHRMIYECIGEQRNVSDCCWARGVRSERCLQLCDAGHPIDPDSYESENGSQLMAQCANELRIPKERFLWMIFQCLNPDFARVMQLTQMMQAAEARERQRQKLIEGRV